MGPERNSGFVEKSLDAATKVSAAAAFISVFLLRFDYAVGFGVAAFLAHFGKQQVRKN